MRKDQVWRYALVGTMLTVLALFILVQLVRIQLVPEFVAHYREAREAHTTYPRWIQPARGQIYDRSGNLLAGNIIVYEVGINYAQVKDPKTIATMARDYLDVDYDWALERATPPREPEGAGDNKPGNLPSYAVLHFAATPEQVIRMQEKEQELYERFPIPEVGDPNPAGISYVQRLKRYYPESELAFNILGFVGFTDDGDQTGLYGVEEYYEESLAVGTQVVRMPNDPNRANELPHIPQGTSLVLTIDREIQSAMEEILTDATEANRAKSGTLIVLDPETGEILAMAVSQRMDLNRYQDYPEFSKGELPFNRAISQPYEPGSVFKVLTMAAGLDSGAVTPETTFTDQGQYEIGGITIYNWNYGSWGVQTMQGCMQHSLNVCLAALADLMGPEIFYDYMESFGFGRLTGVDLAQEVPGYLKTPHSAVQYQAIGFPAWSDADLGTNAFGQGVATTPLQMASAVGAVANDGRLMAPHVVRAMIKDGRQSGLAPKQIGTPISAETAHTLTEMLADSLEGEASTALVDGYRVAGKTGTGEIPTPTGYSMSTTNTSFVGWGPVDDPKFVVYIWLEEPTSSIWGSEVAAPIFSQVVERLVALMRIPPDEVRMELAQQ